MKRVLCLVVFLCGCDVSWHHIEWAQRACKEFGGLRYVNEWDDKVVCADGTVSYRVKEERK